MSEKHDKKLMEFVEERVAIWESTHGLLDEKSRDCMTALLWGCLNMSPNVARLAAEQAVSDRDLPLNQDVCSRKCFCERMH